MTSVKLMNRMLESIEWQMKKRDNIRKLLEKKAVQQLLRD